MVSRTRNWLIALIVALVLTAGTEGAFLYLLKQENTDLIQWVAILIVAHEEDHKAMAICNRALEYYESTSCL